MGMLELFINKKEREKEDKEMLLELKGVTPETLENLSNNKGDN